MPDDEPGPEPQLNRSQLTGEASSRASGTFSYGYDGGTSTGPGNPTSFKGQANTFNSNNQVTNTGYSYDGNGSPTTYKGSALQFDPEQRLASLAAASGTTRNVYDGDGHLQRTSFAVPNLRINSLTYRLYDGDQPVALYALASNEPVTAARLTTQTFGADGLVSTCALSASPAVSTFYTFDERGNVSQRTSSTGAVQSSDLYDAYGTRTSTASQADPAGFGGQWGYLTDTNTGLVLCTHRFYDPQNGRWLTPDPIGYAGGINLYGYTGNNPANGSDPSGYWPGAVFAGAGAAGGGGLLGVGITLEGIGVALDGTILGAPVGVVLGVAGAVVLVGAGVVYLANRPVPPDKAYPGTDQNAQDAHDPTSDRYRDEYNDPAKPKDNTPLIGHELPPGKTVDDALEDAWNNPVAGDWKNKKQVFGKPGYPVNRNGDEWLDLRCGGGKVHGFPVSGPK